MQYNWRTIYKGYAAPMTFKNDWLEVEQSKKSKVRGSLQYS